MYYIKKHIPKFVRRSFLALKSLPGRRVRKQFAERHILPSGHKRIYFYHIRKTAGTSFNMAFLSVSGEDGQIVQERIWQSMNGWGLSGDYLYVLHNNYLIEKGEYFYAYSHTPSHELQLPPDTYTITIFRDPLKRVISHYRNLLHYKLTSTGSKHLGIEGHWLGQSFSEFIDKMPPEHLMRQLYMFSSTFDVNEAYKRIIRVNSVFFTENFSDGISKLSSALQIDLQVLRGKSDYLPVEINDKDKERLRKLLEPEYVLLEKVKKYLDV